MKKSMYFKTKDDVLEYYGALENIPSTDLVIVEDTGSMYAVSNNASVDGEMVPTGGETASIPDTPWVETEDLESILADPKSYEFPLHLDSVSACISSSFSTIKDSDDIITSVEYIYQFTYGSENTVTVKVIVHDNENGDLSMAGALEDNLNDYGNDIYGEIYPILTDCTLSIYEEGGNNTRSLAPQYVLEGKIYAWNLIDNCSGVDEITENGFYVNNGGVVGFNIDVPASEGTSYAITSADVYDNMGMSQIDSFTDEDSYLSYNFTLDAMNNQTSFVVPVEVNEGDYNAYIGNASLYINDPGGNTSVTSVQNVQAAEWGNANYFSIDPMILTDQPNIQVDVEMKLYKEPNLYGYPVEYDYVVSGYTVRPKITIQYYDSGMDNWIDSIELVADPMTNMFEGDFFPTMGYPIRFVSNVDGILFPDDDYTISADLSSSIKLSNEYDPGYTFMFNVSGSYHIVIAHTSDYYEITDFYQNDFIVISDGTNYMNLYPSSSGMITLNTTESGALTFTDKDNTTLHVANVYDMVQTAVTTIDASMAGTYEVQVSDTQGSDDELYFTNCYYPTLSITAISFPASTGVSNKDYTISISVEPGMPS